MIGILWGAAAAAYPTTLCAEIETQFVDAAPQAVVYDDFMNDNSVPRPIRGVWWEVIDNVTGAVEEGWAEHEGPDAGCVVFDLSDLQHAHTIRLHSKAKVGTNRLVLRDRVGGDLLVWTIATDAVPPPGPSRQTARLVGGPLAWSTLTVGAWAIHHRDGGLRDQTFHFYDAPCPGYDAGQCYSCDADHDGLDAPECGGTDADDTDGIFADAPFRYNVAHELGHAMMVRRNEGFGSANMADRDFSIAGECRNPQDSPHSLQHKLMVAEAWHEGWAMFYAVVTFNKATETDCFMNYYKSLDWDYDGDLDNEALPGRPVNCETVPERGPDGRWMDPDDPLDEAITNLDYLYESNVLLGCPAPDDSLANRATEYDWVRFWWDLYTDYGWSFTTLLDVIDRTDPHTWIGGEDDHDPDPHTAPDLPAPTIRATLERDFSPDEAGEWNALSAAHGVDR